MPTYVHIHQCTHNSTMLDVEMNDIAIANNTSFKKFSYAKVDVAFLQLATDENHLEVIIRDGTIYYLCASPVYATLTPEQIRQIPKLSPVDAIDVWDTMSSSYVLTPVTTNAELYDYIKELRVIR